LRKLVFMAADPQFYRDQLRLAALEGRESDIPRLEYELEIAEQARAWAQEKKYDYKIVKDRQQRSLEDRQIAELNKKILEIFQRFPATPLALPPPGGVPIEGGRDGIEIHGPVPEPTKPALEPPKPNLITRVVQGLGRRIKT